ncbi:hypothetical protein [Hymenobacter negativus]|uniref:PH domain-containing protein n=1 Tax=Hymenobacter negativus TaxID=2795026 RepID=A0ABS3QCR7_9BACT|nr:hypothetical protein [Hymenobacter negativus]MBO2008768.1 hypothetical protein [Hymenobacter negativus]
MSSATGAGIMALVLLAVALPLLLSIGTYLRNQKLVRPVILFAYKPWRDMSLWWTLLQTSFGLAMIAGAIIITIKNGAQPAIFIVDVLMLLVAWRCFPGICLWWAYWQWDGQACLRFDRTKKEIAYTNREINFRFAVSEIESLSRYIPAAGRAASADYSYTVIHLGNDRTLVVTSLLCDDVDWLTILPAVKTEVVKRRFAWLPADSEFRKFFSPFSR